MKPYYQVFDHITPSMLQCSVGGDYEQEEYRGRFLEKGG